jgi:flagellar protein FliO/FliZ
LLNHFKPTVLLKLSKKHLADVDKKPKGLAHLLRMFSKLTVSLSFIMSLFVFHSEHVYATEEQPPVFTGPNIGSMVTVIVVLLLIIGLIVLSIRFLAYKSKGIYATKSIRLLGGVGVGQNKSIQLMKIGNAVYIIGVGEDVRLIEKIEQEDEVEALLETMNASITMPGRGLINYLQGWLSRRNRSTLPSEGNEHPTATSFQEIFHTKMQQVGDRRVRLKEMLDKDDSSNGRPL